MEKPLFNSALAIRWQLRLYIGANLRKKQVKNFLSDVTNVNSQLPLVLQGLWESCGI